MIRIPRLAALVVVLVPLLACRPAFDTVRQAPASPIQKGEAIKVRPPIIGRILVDGKPERELTKDFSEAERQRWVALLDVSRAAMLDGLAAERGDLELVNEGAGPAVELALTSVDLAKQNPRGTPKLKLGATLRVFAKDGTLADEVRLQSVIEAEVVSEDMLEITRERRFKRGGVDLGRQAAEYLKARAGMD